MFGQALERSVGDVRFYRCHAARKDGTRAAWCDGFGESNGNNATAVQADIVEAIALREILTKTADEWAALWAEVDRRYTEGDCAASPKADEARLSKARKTFEGLVALAARYVDQPERLASVEKQIEETEATIAELDEKVEGARQRLGQREALRLSIDDLLRMEIATTALLATTRITSRPLSRGSRFSGRASGPLRTPTASLLGFPTG